jgi:hypothetical protein
MVFAFQKWPRSNEVCRRSGRPTAIWTDENVEKLACPSVRTFGIIGNSKQSVSTQNCIIVIQKPTCFGCTKQQRVPPCMHPEETGNAARTEHPLKATFGVGIFSL